MIDEEKIEKLKEWMDDARSVVFFGGAGVSTESGVPDFRSKDGLYNQHDVRFDQYPPEYLLSHSCLVNEPQVYFEFHRQKMDTRAVQPNAAHKYLAALEKTGKLSAIVTQNIDGLHQKAGSQVVYEIHGSALRNYCMRCGKTYPSDYIFESKEPPHLHFHLIPKYKGGPDFGGVFQMNPKKVYLTDAEYTEMAEALKKEL